MSQFFLRLKSVDKVLQASNPVEASAERFSSNILSNLRSEVTILQHTSSSICFEGPISQFARVQGLPYMEGVIYIRGYFLHAYESSFEHPGRVFLSNATVV